MMNNETAVHGDNRYDGVQIFFTFLKDAYVDLFPHYPVEFEPGNDVP